MSAHDDSNDAVEVPEGAAAPRELRASSPSDPGLGLPHAPPAQAHHRAGSTPGPLTDLERAGIAKLVVDGRHSVQAIAKYMRRTPQRIQAAIAEPETQRLIEHYDGLVIKSLVDLRMGMLEMASGAMAQIKQGIRSTNDKIALDTSKWLIEKVLPKDPLRVEAGVLAAQATVDPGTQDEMTTAVKVMSAQVSALAAASSDFMANVRSDLPGISPGGAAPGTSASATSDTATGDSGDERGDT